MRARSDAEGVVGLADAESVFAGVKAEGEDDDALEGRLLRSSELAGLVAAGNNIYSVCEAAADLELRGFTFHKDQDDGEPEEHYSVDLGENPDVGTVEDFLGAFPVKKGRA